MYLDKKSSLMPPLTYSHFCYIENMIAESTCQKLYLSKQGHLIQYSDKTVYVLMNN